MNGGQKLTIQMEIFTKNHSTMIDKINKWMASHKYHQIGVD